MRILDETKLEAQATSKEYFDQKPSSDFTLGFVLGANWGERQIKPMFVLFGEWIRECERVPSHDLSTGRDGWEVETIVYGKSKYTDFKTTEELFELFLEEQTKK